MSYLLIDQNDPIFKYVKHITSEKVFGGEISESCLRSLFTCLQESPEKRFLFPS